MNDALNTAEKTAIVETVLTRAADTLGDITRPVMDRYYSQFPETRALFVQHGGHGVANLEGDMVSQALYCLMWWFESPGEIEFLIEKSVPHHSDELGVPHELYSGLLTATADVVAAAIDQHNPDEVAVWRELCEALASAVRSSAG